MDDSVTLAKRAQDGDREALEQLLTEVRDPIYGLAVRMLWSPQAAEDATQEILIRIMTRLSQFRGESRFQSWAFRVAVNYLITAKKKDASEQKISFDVFADDLGQGLEQATDYRAEDAQQAVLVKEIKIGCSTAMLQCLDREERVAIVLGDILEIPSPEAALILEIEAATYRKRLSRARNRLYGFMNRQCGLVNKANACRCHKRINHAIKMKRLDPNRLQFANHPANPPNPIKGLHEVEHLSNAIAVFRSHPNYRSPERMATLIRDLLDSGAYQTLVGD